MKLQGVRLSSSSGSLKLVYLTRFSRTRNLATNSVHTLYLQNVQAPIFTSYFKHRRPLVSLVQDAPATGPGVNDSTI